MVLIIHKIWEDLQTFYNKNLLLRQSGMNHDTFRPWKFRSIQDTNKNFEFETGSRDYNKK